MPRLSRSTDAAYRQRLLGALVVVLVLCMLLVHGWPSRSTDASDRPFSDVRQEVITMEEVTPTSQSQEKNPPPPSPLPPIVVPNDRIIEFEVDLGTSALQIETRGEDADVQEGASDRAAASRVPDTSARLLRAVQPAYPSAAQDNEIKARVVVEVDVNAAGQVTDAHVTKRWILTNDAERPTSQLGYGLEAAALAAARRSLFRPAQFNGEPVSTRTALTFTFGH